MRNVHERAQTVGEAERRDGDGETELARGEGLGSGVFDEECAVLTTGEVACSLCRGRLRACGEPDRERERHEDSEGERERHEEPEGDRERDGELEREREQDEDPEGELERDEEPGCERDRRISVPTAGVVVDDGLRKVLCRCGERTGENCGEGEPVRRGDTHKLR